MSLFSNICTWAIHSAADAGKKIAIQEVQQASVQLATVLTQRSSDLTAIAQPAITQLNDTIKKNAPQLSVLASPALSALSNLVETNAPNIGKIAQPFIDQAVSHAIAGIMTKA